MMTLVLAMGLVVFGCSATPSPDPATPEASARVEQLLPIAPVPLFARVSGPPHSSDILVLIAGGPGGSHESMLPFEAVAPAHLRVVAYDQRGTGRSLAPPETPLGYAEHVADLEQLRSALGAERMHLLGHSWGGSLALLYAADHPERVASLTLVANALWIPSVTATMMQNQQARYDQLLEAGILKPLTSPEPDCNEMVQSFLPAYFADPDAIPNELREGKISCPVLEAVSASVFELDMTDRLAPLAIPTLVLMGDADPLGLDVARATVAAMPASKPELVVLPACGHFPMFECPEPLFDAVRPFLARVGAS
jgi:pimeloyl-ACP methyl ester carboxylesterase